ncbi:MAG: exo-alpha-sialidase [Phycisphaeraceae bacterium]|nr:exo-alpha-sialidase [Phycisphaerales bacterium]MCB9860073.1 exo-alpha-sialidase [Phycisphaeraceae bacterium]
MRSFTFVLVASAVVSTAQPVIAQVLEQAPMQPVEPGVQARSVPNVPGLIIDGTGGLFQVSIDANGMNIVGDAANEPSIAIDPTAPNRMIIGWRQFDTIASNFREAGVAWTNDGGRTWHASTIDNGNFRSDPVLDADINGNFVYYSLGGPNFLCQTFTSSDGGETWSNPNEAFGGDKAWMMVDRQPTSPGLGNAYTYWSTAANPWGASQFARSFNGGTTWDGPYAFPTPRFRWGTLATKQNGDLYMCGTTGGAFYVTKSSDAWDMGTTPTFTHLTPVPFVGSVTTSGQPNPGGLMGQTSMAIDTTGGAHDGNLYMLATLNTASDPAEVYFCRSTDDGSTWDPPVRVHTDPVGTGPESYQWFGTFDVAPNGRIDVVWNDTRDNAASNLSRLYYTFSNDGGQTFAPEQPISDIFDSHLGWPQQQKLGDYYHLRSDLVGASLAWAATFNGEQDVYFSRIGDWDCNGNGVGDAIDLATGTADDCNANGIPDSCDIAAGYSQDVNGNGKPDECEDCYADCDSNGFLNIFDYICFGNAYATNDPYADCDGNGSLNVFDYICFGNAYAAGCP